jgi:hypothetical protein
MLWDGQSKGALNNILKKREENKKFFVILDNMVISKNNVEPLIQISQKQKNRLNNKSCLKYKNLGNVKK